MEEEEMCDVVVFSPMEFFGIRINDSEKTTEEISKKPQAIFLPFQVDTGATTSSIDCEDIKINVDKEGKPTTVSFKLILARKNAPIVECMDKNIEKMYENGTKYPFVYRSSYLRNKNQTVEEMEVPYNYIKMEIPFGYVKASRMCNGIKKVRVVVEMELVWRGKAVRTDVALSTRSGIHSRGLIGSVFFKDFVKQYNINPDNVLVDCTMYKWVPKAIPRIY